MKTIELRQTPLDPELALGTIAECVSNPAVTGSFDNFEYCAANGRQLLLGHHDIDAVRPGHVIRAESFQSPSLNYVFVSKDPQHQRHAATWQELRYYLEESWVIGTERYPGVKIWFASTARNSRRELERIFVLHEHGTT